MSDPSQYEDRDVLIMSQLLHSNNINSLEKLRAIPSAQLDKIIHEWTNHVSNKLENKTIGVVSASDLIELYENLLKKYEVETTVELANASYYNRMESLKTKIAGYKSEFQEVLSSE